VQFPDEKSVKKSVYLAIKNNEKTSNLDAFFIGALLFLPILILQKKYDLVFCYQPSPVTTGLVSYVVGKALGIKKLIWVQDLWPESLEYKLLPKHKIFYKFFKIISNKIYRNHDYICCQSRGIQQLLKSRMGAKPIHYLPNFAESQYESVAFDKKRGKKFNLVFTGNIGESQDFETIVLAIAKSVKINPLINLIIVGDGRYKNTLAALIKNSCLENNIILIGSCSIEAVIEHYNNADVMLVSLRSTLAFNITVPGKIQSYLMAGKPMVGSISGETKNLINDNQLGIAVEAGDSNGLSDAILRLSNMHQDELREISIRCRNYYKNNFSSEKFMEKLCAILNLK
jgi:glycosyltransferase involved in cell wall biosynthesis